jgi:hypothetical protein
MSVGVCNASGSSTGPGEREIQGTGRQGPGGLPVPLALLVPPVSLSLSPSGILQMGRWASSTSSRRSFCFCSSSISRCSPDFSSSSLSVSCRGSGEQLGRRGWKTPNLRQAWGWGWSPQQVWTAIPMSPWEKVGCLPSGLECLRRKLPASFGSALVQGALQLILNRLFPCPFPKRTAPRTRS